MNDRIENIMDLIMALEGVDTTRQRKELVDIRNAVKTLVRDAKRETRDTIVKEIGSMWAFQL